MKTNLFAPWAALALAAAALAARAADDNLLANGSFEAGQAGRPSVRLR